MWPTDKADYRVLYGIFFVLLIFTEYDACQAFCTVQSIFCTNFYGM